MFVTTAIDGDTAVISPRGEIDFDALPDLLAAPTHLPRTVTRVVWDLHQATFMDIAGLHLLAGQRDACRRSHRELTVTGLGRQAEHLLLLARSVFPAYDFDEFLPSDASPAQVA
ncbi:STAS domain-containing protein [Streptomyces sp. NPDC006552]|uniref:STAS domain-containing protein n=1 Tax=Streptomyces sp. NPDC006552 TaxID=3157179 RepID=UPI0033B6FC82